jgi:hypothetical protein
MYPAVRAMADAVESLSGLIAQREPECTPQDVGQLAGARRTMMAWGD